MYSLEINFLKDRQVDEAPESPVEKQTFTGPTESKLPLILGGAAMVILPAMAGGYLWFLNKQQTETASEIQTIEGQINQLQARNQEVEALQQQIAQINERNEALVSVFNQIKPWSAIFEDISDRIPVGVQLDAIEQNNDQLVLSGVARSYTDVNNLLLALQQSSFLKADQTVINSAQEASNPASIDQENAPEYTTYELPEVVSYNVSTELSDVAASEILSELAGKGADGLVTRIRTLEQKGAITR